MRQHKRKEGNTDGDYAALMAFSKKKFSKNAITFLIKVNK